MFILGSAISTKIKEVKLKMCLSKKNYIPIAQAIGESKTLEELQAKLKTYFKADNYNFDVYLFRFAVLKAKERV